MSLPAARVKEEPVGSPSEDIVKEEAQLDYVESAPEPSISEGITPCTASVKREQAEIENERETWCLDSGSSSHNHEGPVDSELVSVKQETSCLDGSVSEGMTVKDELVLGPECVQQPGRSYVLCAPAASRACAVRIPRAPALEARVAGAGRDPDKLYALRFVHCEVCKIIKSIDVTKPRRKSPVCHTCEPEHALKILNHLKNRKQSYTHHTRKLKKVPRKPDCDKSYTCEICKVTCPSLIIYRQHKDVHAGFVRKNTLETESSTQVTNKHTYSPLVKYLDGTKTRRFTAEGVMYYCEICQKKFPKKVLLQAHKETHVVIWKYSCNVCKKRFRRRQNMNMDKISFHYREVSRLCDACEAQKAMTQLKHLCKSKALIFNVAGVYGRR